MYLTKGTAILITRVKNDCTLALVCGAMRSSGCDALSPCIPDEIPQCCLFSLLLVCHTNEAPLHQRVRYLE